MLEDIMLENDLETSIEITKEQALQLKDYGLEIQGQAEAEAQGEVEAQALIEEMQEAE